jgi:hypothetical protein
VLGFFSSPPCLEWLLILFSLLSYVMGTVALGTNGLWIKANHSPPFSAKFKSMWNFISMTLHLVLRHSSNFTFFFQCYKYLHEHELEGGIEAYSSQLFISRRSGASVVWVDMCGHVSDVLRSPSCKLYFI